MNGPLSGKQKREYLKFAAKEQREDKKAELEESRKQELHEIKLQEAAQKANQSLSHKEDVHAAKMEELGGPLSEKKDSPKLGPISPKLGPTDTVPAMLTPGEAVIPRKAAQDPMNKPIIAQMVAEGRQGYATGTINVRDNLPSIPIVGVKKRGVKGYASGTTYAGEEDPYDRRLFDKPVVGIESQIPQSTEVIPTPVPMMPVPNEKAMRSVMANTPTDDAFYSNIKERPQQDIAEITKELDRAKPGSEPFKILTAELAKRSGGLSVDTNRQALVDSLKNFKPYQKEFSDIVSQIQKIDGVTKPIPQTDKKGLDAPWWSPEYVKAANASDLNGLELERLRRKEAGKEGISSLDPLQSVIKHGVVGEIPKPSGGPAAVVPPITGGGDGRRGVQQGMDPEELMRINTAAAQVGQQSAPAIEAKAAEIASSGAKPDEQKSMLASFISSIYGKEGIFNEKDLARFAVMAAGGLVTGGSVNGSLRYAAKDTLANADKRAAQEYASNERKVTAQESELRSEKTKFESINSQVSIPSAAKKEIEKMLTFKPNATTAEKTEVYRQANILLGQHAARAAAAASVSMAPKEGYMGNKQVQYWNDKAGNFFIQNGKGERVLAPQRIIPSEEHDRITQRTRESLVPRISKWLSDNNSDKNVTTDQINTNAKAYASYFQNIISDMDIDPSKIGSLVESTLRSIDPKSGSKLSEAALEKAVYGNAVMQLRETVKDKYYSAYNKDGKTTPSAEALVTYGNAVTNLAKEKKVTIDAAAILLEKKWDDFLKSQKNDQMRKLYSEAKVEGYSPMMQWVRTQK